MSNFLHPASWGGADLNNFKQARAIQTCDLYPNLDWFRLELLMLVLTSDSCRQALKHEMKCASCSSRSYLRDLSKKKHTRPRSPRSFVENTGQSLHTQTLARLKIQDEQALASLSERYTLALVGAYASPLCAHTIELFAWRKPTSWYKTGRNFSNLTPPSSLSLWIHSQNRR
jgi:hypothetical protein